MRGSRLAGPIFVVASLGIWEGAILLHLFPALLLPSPAQVLEAFRETCPNILLHAAATLARALSGFLIGSVLGIVLGLAMSWDVRLFAILDPLVESLRPVPAIAAIPFFILWFGTGNSGQLLLTTLSCAVVLAVEVFHAARSVSPVIVRAAQSLGAGKWTLYRSVILPAILPSITPGLRIVGALSFSIAVASEFIGAQWGLGFVIMRARRTLETQTILLGMLMIGMLARSMDLTIRGVMARLTRWAESSSEMLQQPRKEIQS